jgi:uncharacterized membrane protein YdjX (TVP38/TMEM64 family)
MTEQNQSLKSKLKLIGGIGLIILLAIAAQQFNLSALVQNSLLWVKSLGIWGAIAFITIYNFATILFIPGSILTLGGGALFGVFWGSIYVFIAATLGATSAFLIGRYLTRDWVAQQIAGNIKFQAIDRAVAQEGLKIVLLTRLSPIFPFNLLNYAFGVTQVSIKDYILGSIGMIPGTIMYVYLGSLAGDLTALGTTNQHLSSETQIAQWAIRILGLIATIAVTIYVTRIAKQSLNQIA